jgi:hypothetical protein
MILNKVYRTPYEKKKFVVFVRNADNKIVKVRFGDNKYKIKRNIKKNRTSFLKRHKCNNAGPKDKARYWSCLNWKKNLLK